MSLYEELKRRNVVRVAVAYLAVSWVFLQAVDIVLQNTEAPSWVFKAILALMGIGFVLALVGSWAFELTPDGLKREADVDREHSTTRQTGRKLTLVIVVFLAIGAGYFVVDRLKPDASAELADSEAAEGLSSQTAAAPAANTLAVLPFTNISGDAANEPFTLGMHDDLLTHLTRIKSLRTISRTSVLLYRESALSLPQIATELGVANILEGSIQRAGNRVRINMQLIEAGTDVHLWAEIYDRDLTTENLFDVQADIATEVTRALRATLLPEEKVALAETPTQSMAAYDLYLLGRYHLNQATAESAELARGYFEQAIADDPNYVRALSGLSDAYRQLVAFGNMPGNEGYPLAQAAVDQAMAIDGAVSEVWVSQGFQQQLANEHLAALESYERAIELDELNFYAWYRKGIALDFLRRFPESLSAWQTAYTLEPMYWLLNARLGYAYNDRGDFVLARQHFARVDQVRDTEPTEWKERIARTFLESGELARAIADARKVLALEPDNTDAMDILIEAYLRLDDLAEAERWVDRALSLDSFSSGIVLLNFARGDFAGAMAVLDDRMVRLGYRDPNALARKLISASYGNRVESGWTYLDEVLGVFDGWPPIDPTATDQTLLLHMLHFIATNQPEEHFGERWKDFSVRWTQNLDRIVGGLETLLEQDFVHPMMYYSLAQGEAMRGNIRVALEHLDRAVDQGFMMLWHLQNDPQLDPLRGQLEFAEIQARVERRVQSQRELLSAATLEPYVPPQGKEVVMPPREMLERYVGYYTDGNFVAHVYLDDLGRFWGRLGYQAAIPLLAIGEAEFYPAGQPRFATRFITDENNRVTHFLVTGDGRETRYKRIPPPPPAVTLSRDILERYVGTYDFDRFSDARDGTSDIDIWTIRVFVDDEGAVWFDYDDQPDSRIVPYSETEFFTLGFMGNSEFFLDPETGKASHFIRTQDGWEMRFERRE